MWGKKVLTQFIHLLLFTKEICNMQHPIYLPTHWVTSHFTLFAVPFAILCASFVRTMSCPIYPEMKSGNCTQYCVWLQSCFCYVHTTPLNSIMICFKVLANFSGPQQWEQINGFCHNRSAFFAHDCWTKLHDITINDLMIIKPSIMRQATTDTNRLWYLQNI